MVEREAKGQPPVLGGPPFSTSPCAIVKDSFAGIGRDGHGPFCRLGNDG